MSSSVTQFRNEKRKMEEAVARVREVVHSASKEDIILALHNFDLDVSKTIQAFCDDGAQSALDAWERSGTGGSKKKSQKKKKAASTPIPAPTASSATSPSTNGHTEFNNNSTSVANGVLKEKAVAAAQSAPSAVSTEVRARSIKQKTPLPANTSVTSALVNFALMDSNQKDQAMAAELARLKNHGAEIEKIEASFENELSLAEQNVRTAFKNVRQLLVDRESHLLAELKRCHDDGARILNERRVLACELHERAERMAAMSDREQAELREEMARFAEEARWEMEVGHATRFLYDNTQLVKHAKNFGEVVGVKGFGTGPCTASAVHPAVGSATAAATPMKNSTSHSSIVSSVGDDSGLGQVSPVTSDERKHLVEVSNGGILMKSDALSAEQLAELNKKLQESLKAQGIDASLLSNIGGLSSMPTRRRAAGGSRGGAKGGGAPRSLKSASVRVPDLSILHS